MKNTMNKLLNIKGFTFIELIISISILAILSILGFISYSKNLEDSRDSQRQSDFVFIINSLKLHKTRRGSYPLPGESFNIVNSGVIAAIQGKMDKNVVVSTIDEIPLDPFTKNPYVYSVWRNKQDFQIAATLENNGTNRSILRGDYKVVMENIIPTLVLAIYGSGDIEINELVGDGGNNRNKFVFDNTSHNLPYAFNEPFLPYSDNTPFTGLINDPRINFENNNNYLNCNQIFEADKNVGTGEYQVNNYGVLENVNCNSYFIPRNCKEIKDNFPLSTDGVYTFLPDGVSRAFSGYCDMSTASGGWTLVAKSGEYFKYNIGHCNFMNPPISTVAEEEYIFWACDIDQTEMLFWTPSGWVVGTSILKDDCGIRTTKVNNNTCSWTGATSLSFSITQSGGCMTGTVSPINGWLWWKGGDWGTGVTKNLSKLATPLIGTCNNVPEENTSYCNLFDIYDSLGNGIGQGWGYRAPSCGGYIDGALSLENHLILVR